MAIPLQNANCVWIELPAKAVQVSLIVPFRLPENLRSVLEEILNIRLIRITKWSSSVTARSPSV